MLNTFIFFDLETTGLIIRDHMPKITELSLIAVSRSVISDTTRTLPRVLSKLVLPINPLKHICQKVETITGLSNTNLGNVESFTCETYDMIINFIKRLVPPVCFVAYNGYRFDYPILLKELENINKHVSEDILCIDMLLLIKDFFSSKDSPNHENVIQANTSTSYNTEDIDIMLDDDWNDILSAAVDNADPHTSYYEEMQKSNEKTPQSQVIKHSSLNLSNRKGNKTKRRLNFENNKPSNFKLTTVYEHICGANPLNAHSAEGDCIFMIECAVQIKRFFLDWADQNAVPIINYKK